VTTLEPETTVADITTTTAATPSSVASTTEPGPATTAEGDPFRVLVFHETAGFRHGSIEAGVASLEELGGEGRFQVTATGDSSVFSVDGLDPFQVVVFLNTTGDVLDGAQQEALEGFIASGKGFVGVHAAADTEYDWPWYGELIGAYFDRHPEPQEATVTFADPGSHPITTGLPDTLQRFDEWYDFRSQPPAGATILATVDESTYDGGTMGDPHPIVWSLETHGGRAVYLGFGHTAETYDEPAVRALLDNAVQWAASRTVRESP
jgi:type 1 glutamine amidotransferase